MASDSFTNSDGTTLSTHDANWAKGNGYTNNAQINTNQVRNASGFQNVAYYYSASTSDDCQIVKKGLPATVTSVRNYAAIRMNASRLGYLLRLDGYSDPNATTFSVLKNTTTIGSGNLNANVNVASDFTLRIQATASGSDQQIRVWVNGTQQTFSTSAGGASHSGMVLTDPSANTPFTDGSPGFYNSSSAAQADTYWDDWNDLVSSGGTIVPHAMHSYRLRAA